MEKHLISFSILSYFLIPQSLPAFPLLSFEFPSITNEFDIPSSYSKLPTNIVLCEGDPYHAYKT